MCITLYEQLPILHDEHPHVLLQSVHLLDEDDSVNFVNGSIEFGSKNWPRNMSHIYPKMLIKGADRNQLIICYSFYCALPTTQMSYFYHFRQAN